MKKLIFPALLLLATITKMYSQNNNAQPYVRFDFIKVADGQLAEYAQIESEWNKVHESLKKSGKILRWMQYDVMLPSGAAVEHNFVTVTLYKDYATLENIVADLAQEFVKVYPDKNFYEFLAKTDKIRTRVKTEIFENQDGFWKDGEFFKHKYARVDFMNTDWDRDEAYTKLEQNFWKPFHKKYMDAGHINGWQLCTKIFRSATDTYNKITISLYDNFAQSAQKDWGKVLRDTHKNLPDAAFDAKIAETEKSREYKAVELWRLVKMY